MKKIALVTVLISVICLTVNAVAQTKEEKKAAKLAAIKALVEDRNFVFAAQYVTPQGSGRRYLNSSYDMKVKKDSLVTYLPYFGQAYFDAPYNPTDGGIKFTSTNFNYKVTPKRKGGWEILLEPRDVKCYNKIMLNITVDGYATAYFTITNKSFINFDGYIEKPENK